MAILALSAGIQKKGDAHYHVARNNMRNDIKGNVNPRLLAQVFYGHLQSVCHEAPSISRLRAAPSWGSPVS